MGDDGGAHRVRAAFVSKIAKAVEKALATADPDREEDAGDIPGLVFGHAEHAGPLKQRRQQAEHEMVFAGRNLEPLPSIWLAGQGIDTRCVAMAVEESEHLRTGCDALEHFSEGGMAGHGKSPE